MICPDTYHENISDVAGRIRLSSELLLSCDDLEALNACLIAYWVEADHILERLRKFAGPHPSHCMCVQCLGTDEAKRRYASAGQLAYLPENAPMARIDIDWSCVRPEPELPPPRHREPKRISDRRAPLEALPLFAPDSLLGEALLGRDRVKEWKHLAPLLEARGLPKVDQMMGGRFVPAVLAFFKHQYGLDASTALAPDGVEDFETWKRKK